MAYIDNPYANSLRQAQAMPAVQQALGGYEGGMDGLMRLFQQQQIQQQPKRYNPGEDTRQIAQRPDPASMAAGHSSEPIPQMQQDYRENYMRNYMNRPDADRISQPQMGQIDAGYNSRIGLPQRENRPVQEDMISQFNKESIARTSPAQQTPQFGGLGSMNSGGMGYGNMFRMQNERMPQYGGYGGYGGGMRPQPYQQMPQPQYQPYASPYQQQYPQPQRYGGYGRQQQYGGYGGGYGGMQNRYQPQQYGGYGGYGQQYGQQYGGGGYGQQYGGGGYGQQYGGGYGQQSGQQYGGGYGQQYGGGYGNQNNDEVAKQAIMPTYPPMY
jgi:hypothetical protein